MIISCAAKYFSHICDSHSKTYVVFHVIVGIHILHETSTVFSFVILSSFLKTNKQNNASSGRRHVGWCRALRDS